MVNVGCAVYQALKKVSQELGERGLLPCTLLVIKFFGVAYVGSDGYSDSVRSDFLSAVKSATVGMLRLLIKCNFRLVNQRIIMLFVDDFFRIVGKIQLAMKNNRGG
jgi:hypothetical protein